MNMPLAPNAIPAIAKASLFLISAVFIFSIQDVIVKSISNLYPVHEILLLRSISASIFLLIFAHFLGGIKTIRVWRLKGQVLRAMLLFSAYTTFYLSLAAISLAEAIALFYTAPFFIIILSVSVMKQKVHATSWGAILVGFVGIILLLKPKLGNFNPAALLAILAACCYAVATILTKTMGDTESAISMAFYPNMFYIIITAVIGLLLGNRPFNPYTHPSLNFLLRSWYMPSPNNLFLMILLGLLMALGFYCLSQAYRIASPSSIAPLEYFSVPLSVLWGYLFWDETLSMLSYLAMILIVGSGSYIFMLEYTLSRKNLLCMDKIKVRR